MGVTGKPAIGFTSILTNHAKNEMGYEMNLMGEIERPAASREH